MKKVTTLKIYIVGGSVINYKDYDKIGLMPPISRRKITLIIKRIIKGKIKGARKK